MYFEIFGLIGAVALILYFFAEFKQLAILGVISSLVVMILGLWVITDNIQIKTGEITTITQTLNQSGNVTGNDTITGDINTTGNLSVYALNTAVLRLPAGRDTLAQTQTTTSTYVTVPDTPYFPLKNFLGIFFVLIAVYSMVLYLGRLA